MRRRIIPYNPNLKALARDLRNNSTLGEVLLWQKLKGKQCLDMIFTGKRNPDPASIKKQIETIK